MKKTILLKSMLLLCALIVGSSYGWAADVVYKTQQFSSETYSKGVTAYTGAFDNTYNGFTCSYNNFNNNNKGWNYVKCGSNGGAYTGTIITEGKIDKAITVVAVIIDAITASKVNSITLYSSSDKSTWSSLGTFDKSTGTKEITILSPAANLY